MSSDPRQVLQEVFGYDDFRGRQREAIDAVLAGRDVLFIMSTGGGKSLCYQVPALILPGTTIVVTPLIALMNDQVATLRRKGVRAAALTSDTSDDEVDVITRDIASGRLKLLYVAPERLVVDEFHFIIARGRIALIAIDEAHCVVQWGGSFRKEYVRIADFCEHCAPHAPRIALTATATTADRQGIVDILRLRDPVRITLPPERPHITHRVVERQKNGYRQLLNFIRHEHENHAGVIYCATRKKVEELGDWLHRQGLSVLPYHAGLDMDMKERHLRRFQAEDGIIMIATIAFGMGIDKPDVRFVAHTEPAQSLDGYFQETGRAGRDRRHADAWLAYHPRDAAFMRKQLAETRVETPEEMSAKRARLEAMLSYCTTSRCRMQLLRTYFGEPAGDPCGNCDICMSPQERFDATVQAKKLLSAAFRTGQTNGLDHLIDILTGVPTLAVIARGHHSLPTFGVGTELQRAEWRALAMVLADQQVIRIARDGGETVYFGPQARPLLTESDRVFEVPALWTKASGSTGHMHWTPPSSAGSQARSVRSEFLVMKDLVGWRNRRAAEAGVPSMVIAPDTTLRKIAAARPASETELAIIVGEAKASSWWKEVSGIIGESEAPLEDEPPISMMPSAP